MMLETPCMMCRANGTNQTKEGIRVPQPASKKLLGRVMWDVS